MKKIFIGCASESLPIAQTIQLCFSKLSKEYFCIVWNQGVFKLQEYTIPSLIKQASNCDHAIFVFSQDDVTTSRGKRRKTTRDNVIYECGLAAGILGEKNCFVIKSKDIILPSDFKGLTVAEYDDEQYKLNPEAALGQAVTQLTSCISAISPNTSTVLSWESYIEAVDTLCKKIKRSPRQGGFRFDVIIGISRGGIIAADLINRHFMAEKPLLCLWGDYRTNQPEIDFITGEAAINQHVIDAIADDKYNNILVIDDITRCGKTVVAAKKLIQDYYPNKIIESAVLYVPKEQKDKVRYYAALVKDSTIKMPYSVLD